MLPLRWIRSHEEEACSDYHRGLGSIAVEIERLALPRRKWRLFQNALLRGPRGRPPPALHVGLSLKDYLRRLVHLLHGFL